MGNSIWHAINVRCPATWGDNTTESAAPWFIDRIAEEMFDYTEVDFDPTINVWNLCGMLSSSVEYGELEPIFNMLRDLHIPFEITMEGGPDWPAEHDLFDGWLMFDATSDGTGPVMSYSTWQSIVERNTCSGVMPVAYWDDLIVREVNEWWARRLQHIWNISIDHLPELCPPDPATAVPIQPWMTAQHGFNPHPTWTLADYITKGGAL